MSVQRTQRLAGQIRQELTELMTRSVKDPGIGFLTLTSVRLTPDLQLARVFFTVLGDDKARKETARALDRAKPFLRRQLSSRLRLRRVPELDFRYDESIEQQDRIEQILKQIREERGPDDEG